MTLPLFDIEDLGQNCFAIHDAEGTVAIITSQGFVDWLRRRVSEPGPRIKHLYKETHLSYTLGFKLQLNHIAPATDLKTLEHRVVEGGKAVELVALCQSKDGAFQSETRARLGADAEGRYVWSLHTRLSNVSANAKKLQDIEYNNLYPSKAGRCFMFAPEKEYQFTLLTDKSGQAWKFPHQHIFHYGGKTAKLEFVDGAIAGFFNEASGNPIIVVDKSTVPLSFELCDMYYDLHCCARIRRDMQPGEAFEFAYRVYYAGAAETQKLLANARNVEITAEDHEKNHYPRIELGMNRLQKPVRLDALDDASGFRPHLPGRLWLANGGPNGSGALCMANSTPKSEVWGMEPFTQIPANSTLRLSAMVMTDRLVGRGFKLRLRYFTFVWHPTPHTDWLLDLESKPVSGTTDWTRVELPPLKVPPDHLDYLIHIELILDGAGSARLSDLNIDLQRHSSKPTEARRK